MPSIIAPTLPNELFGRIVHYLGDDKTSLANVCLASQTLDRLARPCLYRTFRQRDCWYSHNVRALCSFARTAIERPDLARCVKTVSLSKMDGGGGEWDPLPEFIFPICASRIDLIWATWLHFATSEEFRDRWRDQVRHSYPQGILTVLLCSLPSLEQLYFEEGHRPDIFTGILDAVTKTQARQDVAATVLRELPFCKLHSVRTMSTEPKFGWCAPEQLHRLFDLSKLQAFEIARANGPWMDEPDNINLSQRWPIASRSSKVARLSFQQSNLTASCVRGIVSSCAGLREFHFSHAPIHMYEAEVAPLEVLQALLPHADTLEVLHANFLDDWGDASIRNQRFDSNLLSMSRLKRLSVSFSAIFGVLVPEFRMYSRDARRQSEMPQVHLPSLLPPGLEELEVLDCDARIEPHLRDLADARKMLPNLRSVRCLMVMEQTKETLVAIDIAGTCVEYVFMDQAQRWTRGDLDRSDASALFNDEAMLCYKESRW